RMPGMKAPLFFRLSAVSRLLNTRAVKKKQKKMISAENSVTYKGWCGASAAARSPSQRMLGLLENQLVTVAGSKIMDEAKMGGITPAMLSFRGKWELCPP